MPSMLVSDMSAAVAGGGGGTIDIIPPAGQAYKIVDFGSDVALVTGVPDLSVALRDAILADAIVLEDPTTDPGKRVNQQELYITPANLRVTNEAAGAANLSYYGERVDPNIVITDLVEIGAGATVHVRPPAGETWKITGLGASAWSAVDINPDVTVGITDGTLEASIILRAVDIKAQDKVLNWYIDNTTYLCVTDTDGGGLVFGFSGIRVAETSIGDVQDIAGAAVLDIQPPATQQWTITEIAAQQFVGGAGAGYPDMSVSMVVGANLSEILDVTSIAYNYEMELKIDNTHFLRITDISGINNEVGWLGILDREYS